MDRTDVGFHQTVATDDGRALGRELARLCDVKLAGKADRRCNTCAFRAGGHVANGSPGTLMNALKAAMEGDVFWCHEHDLACAGWAAMRFGECVQAPWDYVEGRDAL
jgi:hypothetical protein